MLKSSSLLYSVAICFILLTITFGFVLFGYFNGIQIKTYKSKIEAINLAESGINYLMTHQTIPLSSEPIQLFEQDELSQVILKKKQWGLFQIISAQSFFRKDTITKTALIGYAADSTKEPALYLSDRNQPLSLAGNAAIKGKAYLSKRGLKRAYIEGQSYKGSLLLSGSKLQSEKQLPEINENHSNSIDDLLKSGIPSIADTIQFYDAEESAGVFKIDRSFNEGTLGIYAKSPIELFAGSIKGNVLIKSETEIIIRNQMNLENVLLIAPIIRIQSESELSAQLFARDSVLIQPNVILKYPSNIAMQNRIGGGYIHFKKDSKLIGDILLNNKLNGFENGLISLDKGSVIIGNLVSTNKTELKGSVIGTIATEKFYLKTPSSVYENHILGGKIDFINKPKKLAFSGIIPEWYKQPQQIITWLN